jgi:hypothetical protein
MHTAELLVFDPSPFEVEITIAKMERYKSPGSDQILVELIQSGGETSINSVLFGIRKNYLISGRSLLLYQFTRRAIKVTIVIIVGYHCLLSASYKILSNILSRLRPYIGEIIGDHQCGFRCNR